ncbi:MAG TPA: flagellar filament capping protein FliD, partial [Candidatus Ozemobacteraceae bacterium]|nr:flagellar filament capping protein FliD [Candidatus Ozemobacteraceae bacterium]
IGSSNDTSNFLSVTGLVAGSQATSAAKESSASVGAITANQANTVTLSALPLVPAVGAGTNYLRVTVNGVATDVAYQNTDTLNKVLDEIRKVEGIEDAYYDETTQKVKIVTSSTGTSASLKIEDVAGGTLGAGLKISADVATGTLLGDTMVGGRPLSAISTTKNMGAGGFATPITSGNFTINGVSFLVSDPNSVSLQTIIDTINNNTRVGVTAKYDESSGSLILTSKGTGNTSISLGASTDTSNFLSAVGLMNTPQQIGQNAIYRVKGMFGDQDQVSQSNEIRTIATGLTVTLKSETDAAGETVNVQADTSVARKAIDDFITSYNETMTMVYTKLSEKRDYTLEALSET